ncbi:Uncharacterised protein [Escherichia coli]|nr:Uncharacterised protein [Escherichia coli]
MPLRFTPDALRFQGAGIDTVSMLIAFKIGILEVSPAFTLGDKMLFALCRCFPETHLFSSAALRYFRVCPFEILLRVTVNPVIHPFRKHNMRVRLFAAGNRRCRVMDGKLIRMTVADFLADERTDEFKTLCRIKLTRQGNFNLSIGAAVGAFKGVCRLPEFRRIMRRPCRHVAGLLVFKVGVFFAGILSLTRNVIGMGESVTFPAGPDAEMIGGHCVLSRGRRAPFLNKVKKRLSAP